MTRCKLRNHVATPATACDGNPVLHRPGLAGTPTGYKTDRCRCCDCRWWNTDQKSRDRAKATRAAAPLRTGLPATAKATKAPRAGRPRKAVTGRRKTVSEPSLETTREHDLNTVIEMSAGTNPGEYVTGINRYGENDLNLFKAMLDKTRFIYSDNENYPFAINVFAAYGEPAESEEPPFKTENHRKQTGSTGYEHMPSDHGMCEIKLVTDDFACQHNVAQQPRYKVDGHPACYEHYAAVSKSHPKRCRYKNAQQQWVTAS